MQAQKCRARLVHLESADADNLAEWNSTRLKRILVDYMLRMSYFETAMKLSESSNIQVFTLVLEFLNLSPNCCGVSSFSLAVNILSP